MICSWPACKNDPKAYSACKPGCLGETITVVSAQALAQHERIRLLEEWMHEIIETWHCGDIKPDQINRGRFLLED